MRKLDVISDNEPRPKPAQHPLSAERRRLPRTDKARRALAEGPTRAAERNRRTQDILHNEQAQRLISGAAYRVGREIEQSLERAAQGGAASTWRDPDCIRSGSDHEGRALRSVEAGLKLRQHWARIQRVLGTITPRSSARSSETGSAIRRSPQHSQEKRANGTAITTLDASGTLSSSWQNRGRARAKAA